MAHHYKEPDKFTHAVVKSAIFLDGKNIFNFHGTKVSEDISQSHGSYKNAGDLTQIMLGLNL